MSEAYSQELDAILAEFSDYSEQLSAHQPAPPPKPAAAPAPKAAEPPPPREPGPMSAEPIRKGEPLPIKDKTTVFRKKESSHAANEIRSREEAPAPRRRAPSAPVKPNVRRSFQGAWLILLAFLLSLALCCGVLQLLEARRPAPEPPQLHLMDELDSYFPDSGDA